MQSFLVRVVNPQPVKKPRSTTDLACGKTKQNSAQNNKTKAGPVQTYLDLGQKSLGKTHACKICGMTYVVDVDDDVDSHVKFCKSTTKLPNLPSTTAHLVAGLIKDRGHSIVQVTLAQLLHRAVVKHVMAMVVSDLGCSEELVEDQDPILLYLAGNGDVLGCLVCDKAVAASRCARITSAEQVTTALVVGQKRARPEDAFCGDSAPTTTRDSGNAQGLKKFGRKMAPSGSDAAKGSSGAENVVVKQDHGTNLFTVTSRVSAADRVRDGSTHGDVLMSTTVEEGKKRDTPIDAPAGAMLGVKVIWVSPAHRKQHIARELLDCARRCLVFGTVIPVSSVAFSQPTEDGFALAVSYCRTASVLAYA